jgi:hypothetical protein
VIATFEDNLGAKRYMDVATITNMGACLSVSTSVDYRGETYRQAKVEAERGTVGPVFADYLIDNRIGDEQGEVWELHGYNKWWRVVIGKVEVHYPGDPL